MGRKKLEKLDVDKFQEAAYIYIIEKKSLSEAARITGIDIRALTKKSKESRWAILRSYSKDGDFGKDVIDHLSRLISLYNKVLSYAEEKIDTQDLKDSHEMKSLVQAVKTADDQLLEHFELYEQTATR